MAPEFSRSWSLSDAQPRHTLTDQGFALLTPAGLQSVTGMTPAGPPRWQPGWDRLAVDRFLKDGGHYRRRRHSCYVQDLGAGSLAQMPHRPHFQSTEYNALHGGIDRMFEPIETAIAADPEWHRLLSGLGELFAAVRPPAGGRWYIEAHQFRIDTAEGVGRPTPEGAHRDGVDFVAVILAARHHVKGGETRVFEADGPLGMRFVMRAPWGALLLDDRRMIHEATPIQPDGDDGHRDTLVLTYRAGGFQSRAG